MSRSEETAGDTLRLNPNCCYQACAGCTSLEKLRDFQGRHPADWVKRVSGPPRLLRTVLLPEVAATAMPAEKNCAECGAFEAHDFGHIWLCAGCHATKAASCCSDTGCA